MCSATTIVWRTLVWKWFSLHCFLIPICCIWFISSIRATFTSRIFFFGTREIFSWRLHTCLFRKWILLFERPYPVRTGASSVSVVTRVWAGAGWSKVCGVIPGSTGMQVYFHHPPPPRECPDTLGPTQSHIQWIAQAKWSGHKAANTPSSSVSQWYLYFLTCLHGRHRDVNLDLLNMNPAWNGS